MKRSILFLIAISAALVHFGSSDSFGYVVDPGYGMCFGEQVTTGTRMQGNITLRPPQDPAPNTYVRLVNDRGDEILIMRERSEYFFDVTANVEGNVNLCIGNDDPKRQTFIVDFKIGAQIVDKDQEIITKEKMGIIEHQVKRWHKILKSIQTRMSLTLRREEEKLEEADNISFLVKFVSICSIIIFIAIAFLQTRFMKAFFKTKKII